MPTTVPLHAARKQAQIALTLLHDANMAVAQGYPLDRHLANYYRQHREYGSRDRRFLSTLAFAWFRWRGWLPNPSQPNELNSVLAWCLDAAALSPAIEYLIDLYPPGSTAPQPLGALSLLEKSQRLAPWLQDGPPARAALVPSWLAEALFYPRQTPRHEHWHCCLQSFQIRPPTWLRIRQQPQPDFWDNLNKQYPAANRHLTLPNAFSLPGGTALEDWPARPHVEIQDLASQCVGLICAPKPMERWWDACAGAGGKSLHLADLMQGSGSILATDTRAVMIQECRRRVLRNRLARVAAKTWDATAASAPRQAFDGVLLDAPCSGVGTWSRNPDARWRTAASAVADFAKLQLELLKLCAGKVRPGGRLVYAVCTLTADETSGVLGQFLADQPAFQLETTAHPLSGESCAAPIWIWPWMGNCNGMFIARLKKSMT